MTTHHLMPSFLAGAWAAIGDRDFFDRYGLDAIHWTTPLEAGDRRRPIPGRRPPSKSWSFVSETWRVERTPLPDPDFGRSATPSHTPRSALSMVLQDDGRTVWVAERLIKEKSDIDVIAAFAPVPRCDAAAVAREAGPPSAIDGIVRGAVPGFAIYGQPGCWQDAAVLFGIEALILETYDDPDWVAALLGMLRDRKLAFMRSTAGAPFDLLELGGGDASSTVISPKIFDRFVAPFDAPLVAAAHAAGQRIVYHTCGGMMPLLERIAAHAAVDAMETFTPKDMGGDASLAEAKARVGVRVCMIGGFDQFHYFVGCAPERHAASGARRAFDDGRRAAAASSWRRRITSSKPTTRCCAPSPTRRAAAAIGVLDRGGFRDLTPKIPSVPREGARQVAGGLIEDRLQVAIARGRAGSGTTLLASFIVDERRRDVPDLAPGAGRVALHPHGVQRRPVRGALFVVGQTTGQSKTSAAICRHSALCAPPPVSRISRRRDIQACAAG